MCGDAPHPPSIPAANGVAAANSSDADLRPSATLTPDREIHIPAPCFGHRRPFFLPQSPFSRSIGRRPDSLVGGRWPSRRVPRLVLGATCLVAGRPHNSSRFGAYPLLLHVRRPEELVFARQT